MLEVRFRGGFSDRNGIKSENTEIQLKNLDERTRIFLANLTLNKISECVYNRYWGNSIKNNLCIILYREVYQQIVDEYSEYDIEHLLSNIKETILKDNFDSVLTLIEAVTKLLNVILSDKDYNYKKDSIFNQFNIIFEREYVGYRFVNGLIMPISNEIENSTINDALNNEYYSVRRHLSKACNYLSNRENPDYENSIKESISAVESICRIITKDSGNDATLGKMLNKLKSHGVGIHGALENAFEKLYGFSSDKDGIRHGSGIGGPNSTFAEAKFMLVSCCAFINYLMDILSKNEINSDL